MSGESKELKIGELSDELYVLKELTWKIPKHNIQQNLLNHDVQSSAFSFAGADWILHLYPYGCTEESSSVGCIKIEIERTDYKISTQCIGYRSYFVTHRGKEFNPIDVTHTFDAKSIGWLLYIEKEKFFLDKNIIAPGDVVTFKCQMRTKKLDGIEDFSEKELEKIIASMSGKISRQSSLISTCECKGMNENVSRQSSFECKGMNGKISRQSSLISTCEGKELTEKNSKEESPPLTPEYDEFSEKLRKEESPPLTPECNDVSDEKPESPVSNTKDVSVKAHEEKPESPASNNKGCDCAKRQHPTQRPDNKTLRDLKDLFINQEDCDVIINVKGQRFLAHRNILLARSPVFASTFRNNMKEKATGIVDVEDCDPISFSDFLCFLYCGNVENVTEENVFSLFITADKYDVQDLRTECLEYMKKNLSVDNFCDTITLATQHIEKDLIDFSIDFFAKHFQNIIVSVKWQSFLKENPIRGNEIMVKALVPNKN